jgi:hypothetical protein
MTTIFIPNSVPSSKNSKIWTGKHLIWSKAAQRYVKETETYWINNCNDFKFAAAGSIAREPIYPISVYFKFVRNSKHKFDYINPLQTVLDLMVRYNWIPDDNADIILPIFEPYEYNKKNPGVYITIKY